MEHKLIMYIYVQDGGGERFFRDDVAVNDAAHADKIADAMVKYINERGYPTENTVSNGKVIHYPPHKVNMITWELFEIKE